MNNHERQSTSFSQTIYKWKILFSRFKRGKIVTNFAMVRVFLNEGICEKISDNRNAPLVHQQPQSWDSHSLRALYADVALYERREKKPLLNSESGKTRKRGKTDYYATTLRKILSNGFRAIFIEIRQRHDSVARSRSDIRRCVNVNYRLKQRGNKLSRYNHRKRWLTRWVLHCYSLFTDRIALR